MPEDDHRIDSLQNAVTGINQAYGEGTIHLANSPNLHVPVQSTGNILIDRVFGISGLPKTRITEIFGGPSSGKTSLALATIARAQREGGIAAFIDVEQTFNPDQARDIGVELRHLIISQPDSAEEAIGSLIELVRSNALSVIVLDSVAALATEAEREGELESKEASMAVAALMSDKLRILATEVRKSETAVLFLNQTRMRKRAFGRSGEESPGGTALKFYASIRARLTRIADLNDSEGHLVGARTKITVVKNKLAPPYTQIESDLIYGEGFPENPLLFDWAVRHEIITRNGSWYSLNYIPDPECDGIEVSTEGHTNEELTELKLGQGRAAAIESVEQLPGAFQSIKELLLSS